MKWSNNLTKEQMEQIQKEYILRAMEMAKKNQGKDKVIEVTASEVVADIHMDDEKPQRENSKDSHSENKHKENTLFEKHTQKKTNNSRYTSPEMARQHFQSSQLAERQEKRQQATTARLEHYKKSAK